MADRSELMSAIDKLLVEKTFSAEAVKAISDLTDKAGKAERRIEAQDIEITKLRNDARMAGSEHERTVGQLKIATDKIAALEAQLKAAEPKVYETKIAEASRDAYKDALHTVFKPNSVREMVNRSVPIATSLPNYQGGGGGGSTVQHYQTSDMSTREEGV